MWNKCYFLKIMIYVLKGGLLYRSSLNAVSDIFVATE